MNYRPEIDGLRTIAILSVLLFHIHPALMPGGFTGVDIFFVLSGFLITGVLLKEWTQKGSIDLLNFYNRRIKRILPSLFLVVGVTWLIGYFILLPDDFVGLGKSIKYVLLFLSNVYFSKKGDYFAPDSDELPLLHTWSLAIEEQFYFIWPLSLLLLFKLKRSSSRLLWMLVVAVGSFILAHMLSIDPQTKKLSYYLPFTRFGELLIGCMIAYGYSFGFLKVIKPKVQQYLALAGLGIIFYSFWGIDEETVFPGFYSFLPSIAAGLVIVGTSGSNITTRFLSLSPMVYIGKHSYALYLWHWPILAYYRYIYGETNLGWRAGLFCGGLAVLLSVISREYFENVLYHSKLSFKKSMTYILAVPAVALFLLVALTTSTDGLYGRISNADELKQVTTYLSDGYCHTTKLEECWIYKPEETSHTVLLLGDSHAGHFSPYWKEVLAESKIGLLAHTVDSCPALLVRDEALNAMVREKFSKACLDVLDYNFNHLASADVVVLAGNWQVYRTMIPGFSSHLQKTVDYLVAEKKTVVVMGVIPEMVRDDYFKYLRWNFSPFTKFVESGDLRVNHLSDNQDVNQEIKSTIGPVALFINFFEFDKASLEQFPIYRSKLIYKDEDHFNENGAKLLGIGHRDYMMKQLCGRMICSR